MDEQRRLQPFLTWLFVLGALGNGGYYFLRLDLEDRGLTLAAISTLIFLIGILVVRIQVRRSRRMLGETISAYQSEQRARAQA